MGPSGTRSSRVWPSGAFAAKKSRCSRENTLRIDRAPARTGFTEPAPHCALSDAEHEPTRHGIDFDAEVRRLAKLRGELAGNHRPQFDDRVVALAPDSSCADDEPVPAQREIRVSKNTTWRICESSTSSSSEAAAER